MNLNLLSSLPENVPCSFYHRHTLHVVLDIRALHGRYFFISVQLNIKDQCYYLHHLLQNFSHSTSTIITCLRATTIQLSSTNAIGEDNKLLTMGVTPLCLYHILFRSASQANLVWPPRPSWFVTATRMLVLAAAQ